MSYCDHQRLFKVPLSQMILFLISCFSIILVSRSFSFKRRRPQDMKAVSAWLARSFWSFLSVSWLGKASIGEESFPRIIKFEEKIADAEGANTRVSLLDLPDLPLDCILEKLSPSELCMMSAVCSYLRENCASDHLWERHIKQKWGRVIGDAAVGEWQQHIASKREVAERLELGKQTSALRRLFSGISPKINSSDTGLTSPTRFDSIKHLYLSLENGKFMFPAQVYNREKGHAGFVLSCYDARLSYDSKTDTFRARYPPYRRCAIEDNIPWDRVRSPPVETSSHSLYVSDCLHHLKPGDRIEIQWRRVKAFSYGWWYGVIGHLETCDGNEKTCCCKSSDKIVIEFNQYAAGSRWRRATIDRWSHREVGDETDGFYGGIRRVWKEEDIKTWNRFWPEQVLE